MVLQSVHAGDIVFVNHDGRLVPMFALKRHPRGLPVRPYDKDDPDTKILTPTDVTDIDEVTSQKVVGHYRKLASKTNMQEGDIVLIDRSGRRFFAYLKDKDGSLWQVNPITVGISYFTVRPRDIKIVFRCRVKPEAPTP